MALTESNMLPLGTEAPDFNLPDVVSGKTMSWQDIASPKATVVVFSCNHCPYVLHINKSWVALANEYIPLGVSFVAISCNDVERYPQDGPDKMRELAIEMQYPFPYLYDESQEVAKAYDAACTPDFYVFDENNLLVYRGQMDFSRPGNDKPNDGQDLRGALDAVLKGTPVNPMQRPSAGCGIKWKN